MEREGDSYAAHQARVRAAADAALVRQNDELSSEVAALRAELAAAPSRQHAAAAAQLEQLSAENDAFAAEVAALRAELAGMRAAAATDSREALLPLDQSAPVPTAAAAAAAAAATPLKRTNVPLLSAAAATDVCGVRVEGDGGFPRASAAEWRPHPQAAVVAVTAAPIPGGGLLVLSAGANSVVCASVLTPGGARRGSNAQLRVSERCAEIKLSAPALRLAIRPDPSAVALLNHCEEVAARSSAHNIVVAAALMDGTLALLVVSVASHHPDRGSGGGADGGGSHLIHSGITLRWGASLRGVHSKYVTCAAWSPDGGYFATGSADASVALFGVTPCDDGDADERAAAVQSESREASLASINAGADINTNASATAAAAAAIVISSASTTAGATAATAAAAAIVASSANTTADTATVPFTATSATAFAAPMTPAALHLVKLQQLYFNGGVEALVWTHVARPPMPHGATQAVGSPAAAAVRVLPPPSLVISARGSPTLYYLTPLPRAGTAAASIAVTGSTEEAAACDPMGGAADVEDGAAAIFGLARGTWLPTLRPPPRSSESSATGRPPSKAAAAAVGVASSSTAAVGLASSSTAAAAVGIASSTTAALEVASSSTAAAEGVASLSTAAAGPTSVAAGLTSTAAGPTSIAAGPSSTAAGPTSIAASLSTAAGPTPAAAISAVGLSITRPAAAQCGASPPHALSVSDVLTTRLLLHRVPLSEDGGAVSMLLPHPTQSTVAAGAAVPLDLAVGPALLLPRHPRRDDSAVETSSSTSNSYRTGEDMDAGRMHTASAVASSSSATATGVNVTALRGTDRGWYVAVGFTVVDLAAADASITSKAVAAHSPLSSPTLLAAAADNGVVYVFAAGTNTLLARLVGHCSGPVSMGWGGATGSSSLQVSMQTRCAWLPSGAASASHPQQQQQQQQRRSRRTAPSGAASAASASSVAATGISTAVPTGEALNASTTVAHSAAPLSSAHTADAVTIAASPSDIDVGKMTHEARFPAAQPPPYYLAVTSEHDGSVFVYSVGAGAVVGRLGRSTPAAGSGIKSAAGARFSSVRLDVADHATAATSAVVDEGAVASPRSTAGPAAGISSATAATAMAVPTPAVDAGHTGTIKGLCVVSDLDWDCNVEDACEAGGAGADARCCCTLLSCGLDRRVIAWR